MVVSQVVVFLFRYVRPRGVVVCCVVDVRKQDVANTKGRDVMV